VKVEVIADKTIAWEGGRRAAAPQVKHTMVVDTKPRRDMRQQAAAMG